MPQATETAPDGSVIERYGSREVPTVGVAAGPVAEFARAREQVYEGFFGTCSSVSREASTSIPHIDVFTYEAGSAGRNFCTIVTSGMSDVPMVSPAPARTPHRPARAELIFYCAEPRAEYVETVRRLARFPYESRTPVGWGDTVPNGNPPAPFCGSRGLDTVLLMPTVVRPDSWLSSELELENDPVEFLWVVPLSSPECNWKSTKGFDALMELLQQRHHPHVYDPNRQSYV
jgi:hypothetical protein